MEHENKDMQVISSTYFKIECVDIDPAEIDKALHLPGIAKDMGFSFSKKVESITYHRDFFMFWRKHVTYEIGIDVKSICPTRRDMIHFACNQSNPWSVSTPPDYVMKHHEDVLTIVMEHLKACVPVLKRSRYYTTYNLVATQGELKKYHQGLTLRATYLLNLLTERYTELFSKQKDLHAVIDSGVGVLDAKIEMESVTEDIDEVINNYRAIKHKSSDIYLFGVPVSSCVKENK